MLWVLLPLSPSTIVPHQVSVHQEPLPDRHAAEAASAGLLPGQTPSTGLRHPSFNHCRIYLRHSSFCWCSNSSKFITNNSNKTRHAWGPPTKFTPAQIKPQSFESRRNSFFYHVYVRALALGCFYSLINTQTFRRALTASVDSCAEIKSAPSAA